MAPCPYSCLENPMDREAWQAAVHSVAELSWTRLSPLALIFNLSSFFFVVCSQHACVHTHTRTHTLHHCLASLAGEKHWGSLPVSVRNLIMAADSCAMTEVCASGARPLQRGAVSHSGTPSLWSSPCPPTTMFIHQLVYTLFINLLSTL